MFIKTVKIKEGDHAGQEGTVLGWRGNGMVDVLLHSSDSKNKKLVSTRRSNIEQV